MHIRIKITLLFTLTISLLMALICSLTFYYFYTARIESIKTQLSNQAHTTSDLLQQQETYDALLINKIEAGTSSLKNKTVQAYNNAGQEIYSYADSSAVAPGVSPTLLQQAKAGNTVYFSTGIKDVILYPDLAGSMLIITAAYDEQGKKGLQYLSFFLWLSFAGSTIIAFASGYFFSKLLLLPIRNIADDVKKISALSLAQRIKPGRTKDEWNYLTETLNDLLNRLQESFDIQRRFISVASHELSTPLTSISSQLEVSLLRNRNVSEYQQVMQSVYQDVRQLSKLTQTLLEFAAVSGNAGGIELSLIRVDEVLMRFPAEMAKLDKAYMVQLEFDQLPEDETKLLVFGNATLLFAAIKNIVSNACKFSANRMAKIKLSVLEKDIQISVEDNGQGIPEHEMENIFHPFYRVEESSTVSGFGMGLPLVNRIVKLHNGVININSVVGKGTTFFITLPSADKYPG